MADSTISNLTDGAPAVGTDNMPIQRVAGTRRLTLADVAAYQATLTQTLTNKTLTAPTVGTSLTLSYITAAMILFAGASKEVTGSANMTYEALASPVHLPAVASFNLVGTDLGYSKQIVTRTTTAGYWPIARIFGAMTPGSAQSELTDGLTGLKVKLESTGSSFKTGGLTAVDGFVENTVAQTMGFGIGLYGAFKQSAAGVITRGGGLLLENGMTAGTGTTISSICILNFDTIAATFSMSGGTLTNYLGLEFADMGIRGTTVTTRAYISAVDTAVGSATNDFFINEATGLRSKFGGPHTITTGANATAFVLGTLGATNPAFTIDTAAASSTNGLKITTAAGSGSSAVLLGVTSDQTNEGLNLATKGTGAMSLSIPGLGTMNFVTNSVVRANVASMGIRLGTTASHGTTAGTNIISFADGTAPAGTLTNACSIFSASGKPKSIDSAGTVGHLLSVSATTTEVLVCDTTLTVTVGATTYKVLAHT